MIQVTIDAFSGRPNPSWIMQGEAARTLVRQLSGNRNAIADMDSGYQGLGFRGIAIEALADGVFERYDLPTEFKIANGASLNDAKGFEIAEQLIDSMPNHESISSVGSAVEFNVELQQSLLKMMADFDTRNDDGETATDSPAKADDDAEVEQAACYIELGKFNPAFWNRPGVIRKNNCYNYASNRKTDTFAQPGRGAGQPITRLDCDDVTRAALADGCHKRYDCFPDEEKPRWLMALVVDPGNDYHWYRKQKEGFWGHKPGGTAARNTDNNGSVILNPETCARNPYTDFCGYFYSCKTQQQRIR